MPSTKPSPWPKAFAIYHAAFTRRCWQRVPEEARIGWYLAQLERTPGDYGQCLAVFRLRRDWEVLNEEAALRKRPRQLQAALVRHRERLPFAANWIAQWAQRVPIAKLYSAILRQAASDQAGAVQFDFTHTISPEVVVRYFVNETWRDAITLPRPLGAPLRGFLMLVEEVGFSSVKPFLWLPDKVPDVLACRWIDENVLELRIDRPEAIFGSPVESSASG